MAANPRLVLSPMTAVSTQPGTAESVRRLKGAHESVQGLFDTLHGTRAAKLVGGVSVKRLSHSEVDLLRAALVFAGAGLDAVLKQLLSDTLPELLVKHPASQGSLKKYAARLPLEERKSAVRVLVDLDPTSRLREEYVKHLTNSSLQGHGELIATRDALGIPDGGDFASTQLASFAPFFTARNEVVHELDLTSPTGRGTFTRRYRRMDETLRFADAALSLASKFISTVDSQL